jgi:hypothetical protein
MGNIPNELTALRDVTCYSNDSNNITDESYDWTKAASNYLIVSPLNDYQDGWWIKETDSTNYDSPTTYWKWYDQVPKQSCAWTSECAVDECCMHYPNTNNLRCRPLIDKYAPLSIGPISKAAQQTC